MTIETKFNIGDEVYFIWNNKVIKDVIYGISIITTSLEPTPTVHYCFKEIKEGEELLGFNDRLLFSTKEDLLKSL